jgi:hypothetical protein
MGTLRGLHEVVRDAALTSVCIQTIYSLLSFFIMKVNYC